LHFFCEENDKDNYGNCLNSLLEMEAKRKLQLILETVMTVEDNLDEDGILDIIMGRRTRLGNLSYRLYDSLSWRIGLGKGTDENVWQAVIRQAIRSGYIEKKENSDALKITEMGKSFFITPKPFIVTMEKTPLSKEELVARLKAIASDDSPRVMNLGAMCYSQMAPPEMHFKCDVCGVDTSYRDWNNHETILELVSEMAKMGYDVRVETVCKSCAEKIKKEVYPNMKSPGHGDFDRHKDIWLLDINHIFYFRAIGDTEYHRAIANFNDSYRALLALLKDKRKYSDSRDKSHYIADEFDLLEFMTGIKFDD